MRPESRDIYRILNGLADGVGDEEFDGRAFLCSMGDRMGDARADDIVAMAVEEGLVAGVEVRRLVDGRGPTVVPIDPRITLKGIQFLEENSLMRRAAQAASGIADVAGAAGL